MSRTAAALTAYGVGIARSVAGGPLAARLDCMSVGAHGGILDFSVVEGGPTYRLERALGLYRGNAGDVVRKSLAAIGLAWVPVAALSLTRLLVEGETGLPFASVGVHTRLLVALPLLFTAERMMHLRTRRALARFHAERFAGEDNDRVPVVAGSIERLRDRNAPELLILALVVVSAVFFPSEASQYRGLARAEGEDWLLYLLRTWHGFVSLPLCRFLILRGLFQWGLWVGTLWRISRLRVRPVPSHPDQEGGIGFLSLPTLGFAPVAASLAAVAAGTWCDQMVHHGTELVVFAPQVVVFILAVLAIALAPTLFFAPHLHRARIRARAEYGSLALDYSRRFHRRWIQGQSAPGDELLGTPDIQSLADLASAHRVVEKMSLLPFDHRIVLAVLAFSVAPLVPIVFVAMPVTEVVRKLLGVFLGGLPV